MAEEKRAAGNPLWKPGVSGNPTGRAKSKMLTDALRMELVQNPARARKIADKIITLAEDGDLSAASLIFDRLEGRAVQAVEVTATISQMSTEEIDARIHELSRRMSLPSPLEVIDVEPEDGLY